VSDRPAVRVRPAGQQDVRIVWEWANDPGTREHSFDPRPITWDAHHTWWDRQAADPLTTMWIGEVDDERFGFVRFEGDMIVGFISVNVAPDHRSKGLGSALIAGACDADGRNTTALVLPANERSIHAFERASFRREPVDPIPVFGTAALRLVRTRRSAQR